MKQKTLLKRLKGFLSVESMDSPNRNGGPVANQTIIQFENGSVYNSYRSIIVVKYKNRIYLGKNWDYSKTTAAYRNKFLGEKKKEIEEKIKSGTYKILE